MKADDIINFEYEGKEIEAKITKVEEKKREIKLPKFYPVVETGTDNILDFYRFNENDMLIEVYYYDNCDLATFLFFHAEIPKWEGDEILPCNGWFPHDGKECPVSSWMVCDVLFADGLQSTGQARNSNWCWSKVKDFDSRIVAFRVCGGQKLL
jgi:hypothetical protein